VQVDVGLVTKVLSNIILSLYWQFFPGMARISAGKATQGAADRTPCSDYHHDIERPLTDVGGCVVVDIENEQ